MIPLLVCYNDLKAMVAIFVKFEIEIWFHTDPLYNNSLNNAHLINVIATKYSSSKH
jgi:hypothetical protein